MSVERGFFESICYRVATSPKTPVIAGVVGIGAPTLLATGCATAPIESPRPAPTQEAVVSTSVTAKENKQDNTVGYIIMGIGIAGILTGMGYLASSLNDLSELQRH